MTAATVTINAPRVLTEDGLLVPGAVVIEEGTIVDVRQPTTTVRDGVTLPSGVLAPGFVDLQVNGFAGVDFAQADRVSFDASTRALARAGTTAFLPTVITAPMSALDDQLARLASLISARSRQDSARALGIHVEGPFLSLAYRGAHEPAWLQPPTAEAVGALLRAGKGYLALVTLAPELPGASDAIRRLARANVVVSLGHTAATMAEALRAVDSGARMVTHLFNAQTGLHHRAPGVAAAGLMDSRLVCGLIADMQHVAPEMCRLAFAMAGPRIALVSDAAPAAGMPPGRYELGGQPIELHSDGRATRDDGRLAGASIPVAVGVARAVEAGVDCVTALRAGSTVPADLLGRDDVGRIAPGSRGDLVWLSRNLHVRATWIDGNLVASVPETTSSATRGGSERECDRKSPTKARGLKCCRGTGPRL